METIYLICSEWNWFGETKLESNYLYAVKDEITARNECKRFQIEYNQKGDTCFKNKRYYYEKIELFAF